MTTCIQLGAGIADRFRHGTAIHLAFFDLARTTVDDFHPGLLGVRLFATLQAGDQLMRKIGALSLRPSQHLCDLTRIRAHDEDMPLLGPHGQVRRRLGPGREKAGLSASIHARRP